MQAIAIVRVSTTEQAREERYSIPHQRMHIGEECRHRNYELTHIFEFVQVGKKVMSSSGHERQQIFDYIKKYGADVVIVHELDRLARSMLDTLLFVDELNRLGVAFISIHDGFDTSTPQGQLQMQILAAFAEYFRKQLGSKVMGGMTERAKEGRPMGKIPYGYNQGESGYVINQEEARIVELIFKYYIEENIGMRGIADRLNSMGAKTKIGNQWSHVSVRDILDNEAYAGTFTWNKTRIENAHAAIITKELYDQTTKRRKRKQALGGQAQNERYLLSGLLRCGVCGGAVTGHIQRKGKYQYKYYICQNYISKGSSVCPGGFINARELEAAVTEEINGWIAGSSTTLNHNVIPTDMEHLEEELAMKERELERNRLMLKRAAEAYEAGEYDIDFFRSRKVSLAMQEKQIQHDIEQIRQSIANRFSAKDLNRMLEVRMKQVDTFTLDGDISKDKARLQDLIDHIEVRADKEIIINYRV